MAIEIAASFITVVAVGAELAAKLYKLGFSEATGAGEFENSDVIVNRAYTLEERKYVEFGNNINGLAQILYKVQEVVKNVTNPADGRQSNSTLTTVWDTADFSEIVGDYLKTLKECEDLLHRKKNFDRQNGFVRAVVWNSRIEPEISHLNDRLSYHSVKIHYVIAPLELTILSDLQKLIHDKHKEVIDKLNELTAIVRGQEVVSAATEDVKYIEVPKEIAERFRDSTNRYLVGHEQRFPLRKGMDAFIRYFREAQGTVGLDINRYLKLLKAIWIMKEIKEKSHVPKDSLWKQYVTRMDTDLQQECNRSMAPFPDKNHVLHLPAYDFYIWPEEVEPLSFYSCIEELLSVSIQATENSITKNVRVLRNFDGTLQIEDLLTSRRGNELITNGTEHLKDLRHKLIAEVTRFSAHSQKAFLMPLYAVSDPQVGDWSITLKSDELSANGVTVPFGSQEDAFDFQQLFTGYSVAIHEPSIELRSIISRRLFSCISRTEVGKLQIWTRRFKPNGRRDSTRTSVISDTPSTQVSSEGHGRAGSTSVTSMNSGVHSKSQQESVAMSFTDNSGITLMPEPEPPLLVLFLHDTEKSSLSFMTVMLNDSIITKCTTCKNRPTKLGTKAIIESSTGRLKVRRYDFGNVMNSNLAAVGAFQRHGKDNNSTSSKKGPGEKIKNMIRLEISFPTESERNRFETAIDSVIHMHREQLDEYNRQRAEIASKHVAAASWNVAVR